MSLDGIFEQRWEFRRKDSDLDSSSEDKGSSSAKDRKLDECNPLLSLVPAEDEEQEEEGTVHNHELNPPKGAQNRPKSMQNTQGKGIMKNNHRRGPRIAKTARGSKKIGQGHSPTSALHGLEMHVSVLVKELNTSREGFMKWMTDELGKLIPDSASASPSKSTRKGKSFQGQETTKTKKANKRGGESIKKTPRSSKKINANGSIRVAAEQKKAQISAEEAQEAKEEANLSKTSTVLALADNKLGNKLGRQSGMQPIENPNRSFIATNYLNLPNLTPRPLAENYLVKPSSSTVRLQPVILDSHRDALSAQQQSGAYYQGVTLQPEREFSRPDLCGPAGLDRSFSGSMSGSMGSHGGFPSTSHLGFKGGYNIRNLGLGGSESSAQENNFPSLRMMRFFGGSHGVRDDDMNNNPLKYSSLREN